MVRLYLTECDKFEGLDQFLVSGDVTLVDNREDADFVLDVQRGHCLTCSLEEFASFLEWSLIRDGFDAIFLSDFYINSCIHRVQSQGLPNLVVKPPIFVARKGITKTVNKQIVVHDRGATSDGIKTTALVFFLLIFSGVVLFFVYTKKSRRRN